MTRGSEIRPTLFSTSPARHALKCCVVLTLAVLAGWVVCQVGAWALARPNLWRETTIAAALCLIPGWLVFGFHAQYGTAAPLAVFLIGTGGRMAAVLIGALATKAARPDLDMVAFALVLGAFYMLSLAIETKLLLMPLANHTSTAD